jgi:uncharacterized protein (DUF1778 family)
MKYENRRTRFMIRVKPSEYEYLRREADERGQKISEYVRAVLFANAILVPIDGRK